jgi:Leucine-rich repeat (LRR) protein
MDPKAQQNFDSRTLALLNRLASRRQNAPSARPESAKVDSSAMGGGGKGAQVGNRGSINSPLNRVPVDLSGKSSGNQRPVSAARIQHFQLQGKLSADRLGQSGAAGGAPSAGSGINIQGRLLNFQMNRDGPGLRTPGDPITTSTGMTAGLGGRLGTPGGPKLGYVGNVAGAAGGDDGSIGGVGVDRVTTTPVSRLLHRPSERAGAHEDDDKGGSPQARRNTAQSQDSSSSAGDQHSRGSGHSDGAGGLGAAASNQPLVVCRSKDEKFANPERLNLDRRKLTSCPVLEGEERLRLLNYQNNFISEVENLDNLPNLIFLDLYNNQLKHIQSLTNVTTLRVLMLGKNHLEKIQGLDSLTRLDVLDLHSNYITQVEHLNHLPELRVLNLAGNQISTVDNLEGLVSLTELNLRRNQINEVRSLETLPNLQRVFVSNNQLATFESLQCIFLIKNLLELALDGNPVAHEAGYRQVVLDNLKALRHLDLKRVTEEERRLASLQARKVHPETLP